MIGLQAHIVGTADFTAEMDRILHWCDLDKNDLGEQLLDTTTTGVLENMDAEIDPDGQPWAPLSIEYQAEKRKIAPQAPMAVLYGRLKTWDQVAGTRSFTEGSAEMNYGTDPIAIQEAVWFTYGGQASGRNQPARPFYGITSAAEARCEAVLDSEFNNAW